MSGRRLAGGDPELPFDQVEAGHRFGHWMLDLKPRVHLEKVEVVGLEAARGIGDEFDRAGADVARGQRRRRSRLSPWRRASPRAGPARAFLDHLLMPALRRAVALVEVDASPMRVGEHLQFDVAGRGDVFFDQHPSVAERGFRLADGALERGVELDMRVDAAHARARRRPRSP